VISDADVLDGRHDVSWGTKGSDKAEALPSAVSKKAAGEATAVVETVEKPQEDIDSAFKETVTRAVAKVDTKEVVEKPNMDVRQPNFFRTTSKTKPPLPSFIGSKQNIPNTSRRILDVNQCGIVNRYFQ